MFKHQDYSNIELPDNYYKGEHVGGIGSDEEWLNEQLYQLTSTQRVSAIKLYSSIYARKGRQCANVRMVEMVERSADIRSGKVKPLACL